MIVQYIFLLISLAYSKVYIHERFDEGFESRWVNSEDKSVTHGVFSRIQKSECPEGDFAIKSMNDSSYYHSSVKLSEELNTKEKPVYIQYVAQYEQAIDCGGAYIKIFSELDQKSLNGNSPYALMIGPDVCGYSTRDIHFIVSHKGTNHQIKNKESFSIDTIPHLFELYIGNDKKFYLKVDGEIKKEGKLADHFDYLPPKQIDDPSDKKPTDWVDEPTILDPKDVKPEDWDERKDIPDPNATKPADWDDATDGDWERDLIPNPNYKGDWVQKQIPNPKFKGVWAPKQIDNPEFQPDDTFADFTLKYVGFDLWTVKSGTIFDEIFITDDKSEADSHSAEVLLSIKDQAEKLKNAKHTAEVPADEKPEPEIPDSDKEVHDEDDHTDL